MKKLVRFAGAAAMCALIQGGAVASTAAQAVRATNKPAQLTIRHDSLTSTNWGGYAVQGTDFTNVSGSWVEPAVKCSGTADKYSSFWVGIDGYVSNSVEQLGTDSDCIGTTPSYYMWWEMYPAASVNPSKSTYPVKPGDSLTASVTESGTTWTLTITNTTRSWTFTKVKVTSKKFAQSSAEWIAESPEVGGGIAKLANFGTMGFTNCTAAIASGASQPISAFTTKSGPHAITMNNPAGTIRATPSALDPTGEQFTMTWHHA
jgi:hypothetical protein